MGRGRRGLRITFRLGRLEAMVPTLPYLPMHCNPDDQAFPSRSDPNKQGLTKREYAACKVLAGIVAGHPGVEAKKAAEDAVAYADELFREMNKK